MNNATATDSLIAVIKPQDNALIVVSIHMATIAKTVWMAIMALQLLALPARNACAQVECTATNSDQLVTTIHALMALFVIAKKAM